MEVSPSMQAYFNRLEKEIKTAYAVATEARAKGYDPEEKVDIPLAENMAERVEGLISTVAPQLTDSGMTKRMQELEQEYGRLSWRVALKIAEEVAKGKFCSFDSEKEAMEIGVRVGFAYHTLGIVSAPLEGFTEIRIKQRQDGKQYVAATYAGPVRGAGGTGAAVSVLLVDYVRKQMGYARYDPTDKEINRAARELYDYHERVTNLQYLPSEEEIKFVVKNLGIQVDGEPTEIFEVSNYKDLPRIETNLIRGGMCLVLGEGICQKAPKMWRRLSQWGKSFDLEWDFLEEFLALQKKIKAKTKGDDTTKEKISPNYTFIKDLVAGRPVLTAPLQHGGFRLRYGRTRFSGFSAGAIHPLTQLVLDKYIATGTQVKVERPGKAAVLTVCDSIDPPIVKLKNGSVIKLTESFSPKQVKEIEEILFLGDILFNYADFFVNGHTLVPAGYCEEWYCLEFKEAMQEKFEGSVEKTAEALGMQAEELQQFLDVPFTHKFNAAVAIKASEVLGLPLHPQFTYYWNGIDVEECATLAAWFSKGKEIEEGKWVLPMDPAKRYLELIGVPHIVSANEFVVLDPNHVAALRWSFGKDNQKGSATALEWINNRSVGEVRDKGGTFIGTRMGRPEKAKMRKLTGSPQVLFPVGEEGGRLRSFQASMEEGTITAEFAMFQCRECNQETVYPRCETCDKKTVRVYHCNMCGYQESKECKQHGKNQVHRKQPIDIQHYFNAAVKKTGMKAYPDLIKGVRGTSNKDHIPECLVKGLLRAKHKITVNKDGTTRYDMTELPFTHFKPKEIRTSIKKLQELGYDTDIHGNTLVDDEQVVEMKPQDLVLPAGHDMLEETADQVLLRVGQFVDDELTLLYGLKKYYKFKKPEDLIGHLVIGLAPHISAGLIGRIIGFSETQGILAHPLWHAGVRRDCDGDEVCVIMLMDALLNFSRQFLPDRRGGRTMDAPLVLTSKLNPAEVDDMVHALEVVWQYPLELYEGALQYKGPWDVPLEQLKTRLGTTKQFEDFGFTHPITSINAGVNISAYKTLPSMEEKLKGQMFLAEKIRAVEASEVATLVIEKHFLKDTKGNLRKFSQQKFRCVKCNTKFRRPPLVGKCTNCNGKIIFTVSEGNVIKYLEPSISLAKKYNVSPYLKQQLELTKRAVEGVFGKEKERQSGLGDWFG